MTKEEIRNIYAEYLSRLIRKLASLRNKEPRVQAKGYIEGFNFEAWFTNNIDIFSRFIIYDSSIGFFEGKVVETEGLEFQSNYDFFSETYFHQFVRRTSSDIDKDEIKRNNKPFLGGGTKNPDYYEAYKKELEEIIAFTGKGDSISKISKCFFPKNKDLAELTQFIGLLYGSHRPRYEGTIYGIMGAYAEIGLERIEKKLMKS